MQKEGEERLLIRCGFSLTFAFLIFNFALLLSHVLCAQVFEKFLEVVCIIVASGFDAEQDAAAAYACVINSGAMFWNACADERADDAASGRASTQAGKRCGNRPGDY